MKVLNSDTSLNQKKIISLSTPDFVEQAKKYLEELKVNIVTGQRFLGGVVGFLFDTEMVKGQDQFLAESNFKSYCSVH